MMGLGSGVKHCVGRADMRSALGIYLGFDLLEILGQPTWGVAAGMLRIIRPPKLLHSSP